ncbi:MAG: hypothetical protein BroJett018_20720 [Chloroflexota bacterium]|nr:MAG: hypothetical protein BroJett018_20720 [Chloroflexota bacterium]
MGSPNGNQNEGSESKNSEDGVNMSSLCRTLARVLALLDENEYTDGNRQDTVVEHAALPDPASEVAPARLAE